MTIAEDILKAIGEGGYCSVNTDGVAMVVHPPLNPSSVYTLTVDEERVPLTVAQAEYLVTLWDG